jgi:hypothetical protein
LRASTYTLSPTQQLYVSLSNNLILNAGAVISGDVAVTTNVSASNGSIVSYAQFPGSASFSTAVSCTGCTSANVAGGTKVDTTNVTNAISQYNSLITTLTNMTGATSVAIANGTTLTPGLYDASSFSLNNSTGLTLNAQGNPNAQFVIRMPTFSISGKGAINLINGAQPDNVIFLYTGTAAVTLSTSGTFTGILLGSSASSVTFSASASSSVGRVIFPNATVQFNSGGLFQAGGTPEPSTLALVGLGLVIVAFRLRSAKKRHPALPP